MRLLLRWTLFYISFSQRDIPKSQQKREIIEYCNTHEDIFAQDIERELQIDFHDVCMILDELEEEGKIQEVIP
jgi:predicted ArsR family transcriptional regulator